MRNIYDVLKHKEMQIQQLHKEIEALRVAARLLEDAEPTMEASRGSSGTSTRNTNITEERPAALAQATDVSYNGARANSLPQFP